MFSSTAMPVSYMTAASPVATYSSTFPGAAKVLTPSLSAPTSLPITTLPTTFASAPISTIAPAPITTIAAAPAALPLTYASAPTVQTVTAAPAPLTVVSSTDPAFAPRAAKVLSSSEPVPVGTVPAVMPFTPAPVGVVETVAPVEDLLSQIQDYYTTPPIPNPMLVDMFAREKGLDLGPIEKVIDTAGMQNRSGECQQLNPAGQVPFIVLTDGTVIAETLAICEFLEEALPEPSLIGRTAAERGVTRMWQRRMEEHFVYPTFNGFRFATAHPEYPFGQDAPFKDFFKDRATPENGCILIPDAFAEMRQWGINKMYWLENLKTGTNDEFICGDRFTVVDIQVWTTIQFFGAAKEPVLEECMKLPWMGAWFERVAARDSVREGMEHSKGLLW